jgi:hypothetical protein
LKVLALLSASHPHLFIDELDEEEKRGVREGLNE